MRRITSILMVMMLCNIFVYAQYQKGDVAGSELPIETVVKIGKAQGKLVPDKWYFLHSPRNPNQVAVDFVGVGKYPVSAGGLVTDRGVGNKVGVTQTGFINTLKTSEGVFANNVLASMVRFVPVEDDVFNIQFGTGNWIEGKSLTSINKDIDNTSQAGRFEFYSTAQGRFAWCRDDMSVYVHSNGAGNEVAYWGGASANSTWQIYDIEIVEVLDKYGTAFLCLLSDFDVFVTKDNGTFIEQLQTNINEGDLPGNYRVKDVEAFLTIHNTISELKADFMSNGIDAVKTKYPSIDDIKVLNEKYIVAYNTMIENRIQRAITNIKPGCYIFYSSAEWSLNRIIALCSRQATLNNGEIVDALAWGTFKEDLEFLWKVEAVEGKPSEYRMINMANGKTHVRLGQSTNSILEKHDTATVCFDWRSDSSIDANGNKVVSFNIRSSSQPEDDYYYLHCGGHQSGKGSGSWVVGWSDSNYTRWYMSPVENSEMFTASGAGEVDGINYWFSYKNEAFVLKRDSSEYSGQIIIPESVEHNGFSYNVVGVADSAFYGCSALTSITLPNGLTSIGGSAFSGCTALNSITIPLSVTNIDVSVFEGCTMLPTENSVRYADKWAVSVTDKSLTTYTLRDNTIGIADQTFSQCPNLTSIILPSGLTSIGSSAFSGCRGLTSIALPDSLTSIGAKAFAFCSSLSAIAIPQATETIKSGAFSGCSSLTNIIIEDRASKLTFGGKNVFDGCPLDSVYIGGKIKGTPFSVNKSLRSVSFANNVDSIYAEEFYGCSNLKNVAMGDAVSSIGYQAFSGCSSLESFTFASAMKTIGGKAFSGCTSMTSLISLATTPPICGNLALDDIDKWSCVLKVPESSISAYQAADGWKEFFFIESLPTAITEVTEDENLRNATDVYTIGGMKVTSSGKLAKGIYIVDGKKVIVD